MIRSILFFYAFLIALISTNVSAISVGPELVPDPGFDDPSSWEVGVGATTIENGQLIVINYTGLILPVPGIDTSIGATYQYSLTVDLVNNLTGGGKITIGGETIWEPSYNTGTFTGSLVASDTNGLVFNFLSPYVGRAEFDSISIKAILSTPIPATIWLFGSGLLGLIGVARRMA